jgi:hypothetical protein
MIPSSVASIVVAAEIAQPLDDETAVFYFDSHCAVICYSFGNRLTLVRPAEIGYSKLVDSYLQVFQEHKGEDAEHELSSMCCSQAALGCLIENGIPFQPQQFKNIELRSSVLPRMAPVLQRIGIDVKQTIRFGIPDQSILKNLVVAGPGAAIPGIARAVGEHLQLHTQLMPGHEQYEAEIAGGRGTTEQQFIEMSKSIPVLLPRIAGDERTRKQFQQAVGIGAAFAVVALAGQFVHYSVQQTRVEQMIDQDAARYQQVARFEHSQEQASDVRDMLGDIAGLVASHAEPQPYWETPLTEIGKLVGSGIRIQELRGEYEAGKPALAIMGYSISENDLTPGQVLDQFVEELSHIDRVSSVRLDAQAVQAFSG